VVVALSTTTSDGGIGDGESGRQDGAVGAVGDGDVPILVGVVVPRGAAVVEDEVDRLGAAGRGIEIGPIGAAAGHGGIGENDILPAVVPNMDAHVAGGGQRPVGGIVEDGDGVAAVRARGDGPDGFDGSAAAAGAAIGHGDAIVDAAVVVPDAGAVVEGNVDLGGLVGGVVDIGPEVAGVGHGGIGQNGVLPVVAADMDIDLRAAEGGAGLAVLDRDGIAAVGGRRIEFDPGPAAVAAAGVLADPDVEDFAAVGVAGGVDGLDKVVDQRVVLAGDGGVIFLGARGGVGDVGALGGGIPGAGHGFDVPGLFLPGVWA
jgi:hypothetical protein